MKTSKIRLQTPAWTAELLSYSLRLVFGYLKAVPGRNLFAFIPENQHSSASPVITHSGAIPLVPNKMFYL